MDIPGNWLNVNTITTTIHRVVSKWNMLDDNTVMAKTIKTKLEGKRAKKMGSFLD